MLSLPPSVRVYIASEPVDMRPGHDGLFQLVKAWGLDPFSGDLFGFIGKRRDRAKVRSRPTDRVVAGRYSLVGSCIANRVEPTEYLTDILARLHDGMSGDELDALLPDRWRPLGPLP